MPFPASFTSCAHKWKTPFHFISSCGSTFWCFKFPERQRLSSRRYMGTIHWEAGWADGEVQLMWLSQNPHQKLWKCWIWKWPFRVCCHQSNVSRSLHHCVSQSLDVAAGEKAQSWTGWLPRERLNCELSATDAADSERNSVLVLRGGSWQHATSSTTFTLLEADWSLSCLFLFTVWLDKCIRLAISSHVFGWIDGFWSCFVNLVIFQCIDKP